MGMCERNIDGLTDRQIAHCIMAWEILCETVGISVPLHTERATEHHSQTAYSEHKCAVYLGANVLPGRGISAVERMSMLACLAHEIAHADRHQRGFQRPFTLPDLHLDEAETSIHASFFTVISQKDREDMIEHSRDHLTEVAIYEERQGADSMIIEPSGVVFWGACSIRTASCSNRADGGPVTAVWSAPARVQIDVCGACLSEMQRSGGWQIKGARVYPAHASAPQP